MLRSFETPLFEGFIKATVRVIGLDPGSLVRVIGRVFNIMFRDSGEWRVLDRTGSSAVLRVDGLPDPCLSETWVDSARCSVSALFAFTDREGEVVVETLDRPTGTVVYRLTWR